MFPYKERKLSPTPMRRKKIERKFIVCFNGKKQSKKNNKKLN